MRVLIGNAFSEELVGKYGTARSQWRAHFAVWHAEHGDVVVLPGSPDHDFIHYALTMKGVDPTSVRIVVPPEGSSGDPRLTRERLCGSWLTRTLRETAGTDPIRSVVPLWPDTAIASLAESIGAAASTPAYEFMAQGGGAIANSKAVFRAMAAGVGVPIPAGHVCISLDEAVDKVWAMLAVGQPAMIKGEYFTAGDGNMIISTHSDFRPLGARERAVVTDRAEVAAYLDRQWNRLTSGGRFRLVVENYHPGCTSLFAEFSISDEGVEFTGDGEMIKDPQGVGEIMPIQGRPPHVRNQLIEGGRALAVALGGIGYRGLVSADAIATSEGRLYFTEYNGRITSSTHIYEIVGKRIVGDRYPEHRVLFEKVYLKVPSFAEAERRLREAGLSYDAQSATGVILTSAFESSTGNVIYTSVGESLAAALELSEKVDAVVAGAD